MQREAPAGKRATRTRVVFVCPFCHGTDPTYVEDGEPGHVYEHTCPNGATHNVIVKTGGPNHG